MTEMTEDEIADLPDSDGENDLPSGLYIIATPIGNIGDMTLRALDTLGKLDVLACEDTRESGKLLSMYDIQIDKVPYHEHNAAEMRPKILEMIADGLAVGLVSDAGMPLVSDPGYKLVADCIAAGHAVTCLPGATASLTAVVLSGLPTDRFMFTGFLPPKTVARKAALADIADVNATLVFYETAPRLVDSLADMQEMLGDRLASVSRELTKKFEETRRGRLSELVAHYRAAGAPKGEIVIVTGAPDAAAATVWDDTAVEKLLVEMMTTGGMSVKDAAAYVASKSGRKKNTVYQAALLLKQHAATD